MKVLILVLFFILEVYFGITYLLPYLMRSDFQLLSQHPEGFYWVFLMTAIGLNFGLFILLSKGKKAKN